MKKRAIKNGKKTEVIISEATDGVNKVRLLAAEAEEEEACLWGEIDAYSGRFVMAGLRYDVNGNISENFHPWLAYSTDGGKTWTPSDTTSDTNQTHGQLTALAYGGGRFVVAGFRFDETGNISENFHPWLAYSTDGGKTWTPSDTTSDTDQTHGLLTALAYGGGRFVVAGYRGDGADNYHPWLAYSTDGGVTWTPSDTTSDTNQPHGELYALAYGGGRFVVAGWRYDETDDTSNNYHPWLAYSTDGGVTWTPSDTTSDTNQPHGRLYALAYGGGRFVVAGWSDDTNDTSKDNHPWLAYSTDGGKTWTPSDTTSAEEQEHGNLSALAYAPDSYCWKFGKEDEDEEEEKEKEKEEEV